MTALTDAQMRAIAEAATQGGWFAGSLIESDCDTGMLIVSIGPYDLSDRPGRKHHYEDTLAEVWSNPNDVEDDGEQAVANAHHIATFDPPTVLALLDERDELRALIGDNDLIPQGEHAKVLDRLAKAEARVVHLNRINAIYSAALVSIQRGDSGPTTMDDLGYSFEEDAQRIARHAFAHAALATPDVGEAM